MGCLKLDYTESEPTLYVSASNFGGSSESVLEYNHFELRMYDPLIGRWLQVDPMRQYASPYVGMGNYPHATDPTGGKADDWYKDKDGNEYFFEGVTAETVEIDGLSFERLGAYKYLPNGFGSAGEAKFSDNPFLIGYGARVGEDFSFMSYLDNLVGQREGVVVLSTDFFSQPHTEWDNPSTLEHTSTIVDLKTKMDFSNIHDKAKFVEKILGLSGIDGFYGSQLVNPYPRVEYHYGGDGQMNGYTIIFTPAKDSVFEASTVGGPLQYHYNVNGNKTYTNTPPKVK